MKKLVSRLFAGSLFSLIVVTSAQISAQQVKKPAVPAVPARPAPTSPKQSAPKSDAAAPAKTAPQTKLTPPPAAGQPTVANATTKTAETAAPAAQTYTLQYKFQAGETIRWRTEHRSHIRTTVKGVTATAESYTESVKVWKIVEIDAEGNVTFENSVDSLKMRQKHSGSSEIEYDSLTDKDPPPVFAQAAESIGVPLAMIKMDPRGKILRRDNKRTASPDAGSDLAQISMTLPEKPVSIGDEWHDSLEYKVRGPDGGIHPIKARQLYILEDVRHGVAIVKLETQILTPVGEPSIEAQLAQKETRGEVRFDIAAGRIVGQEYDLDKPVVNFSGPQSSLHCRTRFTEELLGDVEPTAQKEPTKRAAAEAKPQS